MSSIETKLRELETRIKELEDKQANPSAELDIERKIDALNKARATKDKRVIRATLKQINGR